VFHAELKSCVGIRTNTIAIAVPSSETPLSLEHKAVDAVSLISTVLPFAFHVYVIG
jgi:hypothetical protein